MAVLNYSPSFLSYKFNLVDHEQKKIEQQKGMHNVTNLTKSNIIKVDWLLNEFFLQP